MKSIIFALCLILVMILDSNLAISNTKNDNNGTITVRLETEKDGVVFQKDTILSYSGELNLITLKKLLESCGMTDAEIENGKVIKSITLKTNGKENKVKLTCLEKNTSCENLLECYSISETDKLVDNKEISQTGKGGPYRNKFFIKPNYNNSINISPGKKDMNYNNTSSEKGYNLAAQAGQDPDKDVIDNSEENIPINIDELQYYPNPSNGKFIFSFNITEPCKTTITIFNSNGKEVYYEVINNYTGDYSRNIDLSANGRGIYFLNIEQGNKTINKRLVIY